MDKKQYGFMINYRSQELKQYKKLPFITRSYRYSRTYQTEMTVQKYSLSTREAAVLKILLVWNNRFKGDIHLSQSLMGYLTDYSREWVNKTIRALTDKGLIGKIYRHMSTCIYIISDMLFGQEAKEHFKDTVPFLKHLIKYGCKEFHQFKNYIRNEYKWRILKDPWIDPLPAVMMPTTSKPDNLRSDALEQKITRDLCKFTNRKPEVKITPRSDRKGFTSLKDILSTITEKSPIPAPTEPIQITTQPKEPCKAFIEKKELEKADDKDEFVDNLLKNFIASL